MNIMHRNLASRFALSVFALTTSCMQAQNPGIPVSRVNAGSIVSNPGPVDTSLSGSITHQNVRSAMKKVADWQLKDAEGRWSLDWTYAPLYSGLLAASKTTGDTRYHDAVMEQAEKFHWMLLSGRLGHADDQAVGQAYEVLYQEKKDPVRIAALRKNLDDVIAMKERPKQGILWWWCDALYMAPATYAEMTVITGDRKYLDFADHEWDLTTKLLYVPEDRLYFRDATFRSKTEKNGKKLFWSRGNGWVLAGTARTLMTMKGNDPLRPKYEKLFVDMANRIAALQPTDGLWRMGLLDEQSYSMGEVSGTGFFTYAMAWGINQHLLDRKKFEPVVHKAWAGMLKNVYQNGRLGSIQPVGAAPDTLETGSSWVYGVGAFLLAGSEIDKMAKQ